MKNIIVISLFALALCSCKDNFRHEPIGGQGGGVPSPVTNPRVVENTPGGALIGYDLPDDVNIQYVMAEWTTTKGTVKNKKSSSYVDTLSIQGLGSTDPKTVKLYTVTRKEVMSEPVEITINPLTPPIERVRNSISYTTDFGGFLLSYTGNISREEVGVYVTQLDEDTREMVDYTALYTSQEAATLTVRGLPDKENRFGVFVRDRWDNISDTLFFTTTPWREDFLDKSGFKVISVAGDVAWTYYSGNPDRIFDGTVSNGNWGHTNYPVEFPHRLTIDLGVTVKLSRFLLWQRPGADVLYQHGAPKFYRVYGRADDPGGGNSSDPMAGWTLLRECVSFKPSGLPLGQYSSEDEEYNAAGEEFSFPRDIGDVRFIRFEMLESWSGMKCSVVSEVSFYGEIKD